MITLNRELEVRLRSLPLAGKILVGITFSLSFCMYGLIAYWLFRNQLTDLKFFETEKCPACFGKSYCFKFQQGRSTLTGWSKSRWLDFTNVKNVHYAKTGRQSVVLKKLAGTRYFPMLDKKICQTANNANKGCNPANEIEKVKIIEDFLVEVHEIKALSTSLYCPSQRLLDKFTETYGERHKENTMSLKEYAYFLTTYMVNPEPFIIQSFPPSEGWPFPKYLGACGRYIVEEYVGESLETYFYSPWEERIDLAYQLLKIADLFTDNKSGYALYLGTVDYDSFAVNTEGKVIVTDLGNMLVVDKYLVERQKLPDWDKPLNSLYYKCSLPECIKFNQENLCTHVTSDHNFYAVCNNLLSSFSKRRNLPGGLLHDIPSYIEKDYRLSNLLGECANSTDRFRAKNRLLKILQKLRTEYF